MAKVQRAPKAQVKVTSDLIARSQERDSSHCMIAEAVKAAIPSARFVTVDLQTIRFTDTSKMLRYTYLTPRGGQLALIDFDQGRTPEPFTITLASGQVTQACSKRYKESASTATPDQAAAESSTATTKKASAAPSTATPKKATEAPSTATPSTATPTAAPAPGSGMAIREWGRQNSDEWSNLPNSGPIPVALRDQYNAAHPGESRVFGPAQLSEAPRRPGVIPDVVGGRTPPVASLAGGAVPSAAARLGRRRAFGLRALER